jgi:hypothetical protein
LLDFRRLLHHFDTERFQSLGGWQMRTAAGESHALMRSFSQICDINWHLKMTSRSGQLHSIVRSPRVGANLCSSFSLKAL